MLLPLFHYFKLGKTISHEEAAKIIGDHFNNVEDKLLNVLNLRKQAEAMENKELLFAGIEQKQNPSSWFPSKQPLT